ncbi:MAG: 3-carboxy-cis,cis-muconate cycloisomerase [Armatimonadota bacterium]|nr:3-carboxy-cis,cis-muconate cycloisomerase [Armatimonadota bacterium]
MTDLAAAMFTSPEMAAVFSGPSLVQKMLDFEAALARAQAAAGLVPQAAAEAIAAACRADRFDVPSLYRDAAAAGTLVVPLVRALTGLVGGDARRCVHWGATSQDVMDSAMVLQMRDGLDLLERRLLEVAGRCADLAERHRRTPMAGRTLLQHAVPITFGLKAARWLAMTTRLVGRMREVRARVLAVQLGGAAGTLASLGSQGVRVMELLARELDLAVPDLPWHAERDRLGEIAGLLGLVASAMAKVATDIALLCQTEVGEVSTGAQAASGRSSTMPQKRNPVEAVAAVACARLAIGLVSVLLAAGVQEHERAAGGWQAEWEAVPALFQRTAAAAEWVWRALGGLRIDPERMRVNLDQAHGLIMAEALTTALIPSVGRDEAYQIVQRLCDRAVGSGAALRDVAGSDPQIRAILSPQAIEQALDVAGYLGSAEAFVDRALDGFRRLQGQRGA